MALAEKFLFDISFDAPGGGEARPRGVVTPAEIGFSRAELNAAVAQARAEGHAAGLAEATAQREQRIGEALTSSAERLAPLFAAKDAARRGRQPAPIEPTPAIVGKLFPPPARPGARAQLT